MVLALNGQVYNGWITPLNDCGIGYTGLDIKNGITHEVDFTSVEELVTPAYYYTDTDYLLGFGYDNFIYNILGKDYKGRDGNYHIRTDRRAPVLIRSRNNFIKLSSLDTVTYIQRLFLLAQTQCAASSDINHKDKLSKLYKILDGLQIVPISRTNLSQLKFYDSNGNQIPAVLDYPNTKTYDFSTAYHFVGHATYSCSTGEEYPINFYTRSDGVICDMYIGGYHMIFCDKDKIGIYVSACDEKDFCNKFLYTANKATIKRYDYLTDNFKGTDYSMVFFSSDDNKIIHILDSDSYNPTIHSSKNTLISYAENIQGTTRWLNADYDIYNAIGMPADTTVGVLPEGTDINTIGLCNISGMTLSELNNPDVPYLPLGLYYFEPEKISTYKNLVGSAADKESTAIRVYSIDGINIMQDIYTINSNTYRRVYYKSTSTWTSWSNRIWT